MGFDLNELKFCGTANTIALEEFAASFDDAPDTTICESLYKEYLAEGSPSSQREWLRPRIAALFESVGPRPQWIERTPIWPFLNGKPMTFIGQIPVPNNSVSERMLAPETVVYVFGARTAHPDVPDAWRMAYRAVTQHFSLRKR
jgi:hypothetical protein